ncbi:hypothetical protein SUGI_0416390 [Cryptomeria japonica]|uniref:uncharacterized protein LOC131070280 n=1 Tax=Cryptomeria japonica TaxID=3369 RepID=UPI002408A519|nr:uncharacterized protein LOC131070280 [Cryptomeria japonica]GLJ22163.1 hypothetical protein SUGI_0416390 [Cryptomeria japonica]
MAASLPAGLNSSAQPLAPPRNNYSSNQTTARPSREDIRKEVEDEIRNLHSEDPVKVAKAAAGLVMLATLPAAEPYLLPAVTQLSMLLENAVSIDVQRNACAALTAIMNANLHLYIVVVESPHLMERLLHCLENHDKGLQINVAAAVSVLAQRGEGLQIIKATEADMKLLSLLECADDLRLGEEITDAICALAVHQEMRLRLVTKGAVSRLAAKLNIGSSEICVRVLLGLGMLCGSSQEAQEQLAETDGAIFTLLTLVKSSDPDIRAIAHDLFAALSSNERVKVKIEQMLMNNPIIRGR